MERIKADLSLLLAAFIWGTAFIAQKIAVGSIGPILFLGCRFLLSALLLAPLAWAENRRRTDAPLAAADWRLALLVGLSLFTGMALQQIGIVSTSTTNAGFLTAIYVVMVPIVAWVLTRHRPRPAVVIACCVSIAGAWMLEQGGAAQPWGKGDMLVVISDIPQALQLILVERFLARHNRPLLLSFVQYGVIALVALTLAAIFEPISWQGINQVMPSILYAGLLSGGVAFTLQIVAQRHTPPAEAAIIMSLESVFAALAGAWLLGDRLGPTGLAGCALILAGVLLVQLLPLLRRNRLE